MGKLSLKHITISLIACFQLFTIISCRKVDKPVKPTALKEDRKGFEKEFIEIGGLFGSSFPRLFVVNKETIAMIVDIALVVDHYQLTSYPRKGTYLFMLNHNINRIKNGITQHIDCSDNHFKKAKRLYYKRNIAKLDTVSIKEIFRGLDSLPDRYFLDLSGHNNHLKLKNTEKCKMFKKWFSTITGCQVADFDKDGNQEYLTTVKTKEGRNDILMIEKEGKDWFIRFKIELSKYIWHKPILFVLPDKDGYPILGVYYYYNPPSGYLKLYQYRPEYLFGCVFSS